MGRGDEAAEMGGVNGNAVIETRWGQLGMRETREGFRMDMTCGFLGLADSPWGYRSSTNFLR